MMIGKLSLRYWTTVAAVICAGLALPAQGALHVEITESATGALPIAVVPFEGGPGVKAPVDLVSVINSDLRSTGLFKPLPPEDMLATPSSPTEIHFRNWRQVQVDYVVVGKLKAAPGRGYNIRFQIVSVYQQRVVAGYRIKAGNGRLRAAAHTVANKIYETLTGHEGYFRSRIAYVTAQKEGGSLRYRLVVADYDGHDPHTIVASRAPIMSPAWHPSGNKLAYVTFNLERGRSVIKVVDLRTGETRVISSRLGINGAPTWSPDGNKLAITLSFEGNPNIYIYNLNTGNLRQLTHSPAIDTEPAWSPDGEYIAFTSGRGGSPQIYRMPAEGGSAERITFYGESNQSPVYAPDGESLAMVQGGANGYRIAILNLKTNNKRILSDGPLDESPSFSPNGQIIIYTRQEGGGTLATVSVDGRVERVLKQPGQVREPAWGPAPY